MLFWCSERMDRVTGKRALNRSQRTQSRIATLQLLHHESEGCVTNGRGTSLFQIRRKKSELAHSGDQLFRKFSRAMTRDDFRRRFLQHETPRAIAGRALIVGQEFFHPVIVERGHLPQAILRPRLLWRLFSINRIEIVPTLTGHEHRSLSSPEDRTNCRPSSSRRRRPDSSLFANWLVRRDRRIAERALNV